MSGKNINNFEIILLYSIKIFLQQKNALRRFLLFKSIFFLFDIRDRNKEKKKSQKKVQGL